MKQLIDDRARALMLNIDFKENCMKPNLTGRFSKCLRRAAIASVAGAIVAAPAAYAKSSSSLLIVPPTDLPEAARQTGEAMFLHDAVDGRTLLYIEQNQGSELAILDVTDPGHVRAGGSVQLDATGPFDFISTLGKRAELVRFRQRPVDAVLDLRVAQSPTLRTVHGLTLRGPAMPLGDDGFTVSSEIADDMQPTLEYQVVDTANAGELAQVFDVKQVREELTKSDTGTTFLLTEGGLYLIRRPAVETDKKLRDLDRELNYAGGGG
jgi:hypothetical protein